VGLISVGALLKLDSARKIKAWQILPANLVAIEDKASAEVLLDSICGPDCLDEAALLGARSDQDLGLNQIQLSFSQCQWILTYIVLIDALIGPSQDSVGIDLDSSLLA